MEIVNHTPFVVEVLPFQVSSRQQILLLVVKGTFDIVPNQAAVVADKQIPIAFADEFHDPENGGSVKFESDLVPFKPRADIVLNGSAYAPSGKRVKGLKTSLTVGNISKTLYVIGDRYWHADGGAIIASPPVPFSSMPLVYERAYGGAYPDNGSRYAENPLGRGYIAKQSPKAIENCPLPNIEDPDQPVQSWRDHPRPAGYGFTGKGWASRAKHLGTYDEAWQTEIAPDPPADFSMDFYNGAPADLQVAGYLKGDEPVALRNLTPAGAVNFALPGVAVQAELENREAAVKMRLDTLCLLPDEGRFYLVWRGGVEIGPGAEVEVRKVVVSQNHLVT